MPLVLFWHLSAFYILFLGLLFQQLLSVSIVICRFFILYSLIICFTPFTLRSFFISC